MATEGVRRLPLDALAGLREAFAGEVAERLPRLLAGAPEALRDAHALGSSAYVVGEYAAARCAREVERLLTVGRPCAYQVTELARLLASWRRP